MTRLATRPLAHRAQTNAEYVLFLTVVLAMIVSFGVPAFQDYEINVALSATRASLGTYLAANRTLSLGAIGYNVTGFQVTFRPRVYDNGARLDNSWTGAQPARAQALRAISQTFHQTYPADSVTSVTGYTYAYSINFTN